MIRTTALISDDNGYKKYNLFEIHEDLEPIIADDYLTYTSSEFKKASYCELMYKKTFMINMMRLHTKKFTKDISIMKNSKRKQNLFIVLLIMINM